MDLVALHSRHHVLLREQLFALLDRLVDVDAVGARAAFDAFVDALERGLVVEEDIVMPAYRGVAPVSGPGKAEIVDGDHVILRRSIDTVHTEMTTWATAPSRRGALELLPHVYRLVGVLEHHTEREERHVYPAVVGVLDVAAAAAVEAVLVDVVAAQDRLVGAAPTA
jgi:hypothetical protein